MRLAEFMSSIQDMVEDTDKSVLQRMVVIPRSLIIVQLPLAGQVWWLYMDLH